MKRGNNKKSTAVKRKNLLWLRLLIILVLGVALFFIVKFSYKYFMKKFHSEETVSSLYRQWDEGDYQKLYDTSAVILEKNFLQNAARMFHGYSSFMLAVSKTDNAEAQKLFNEAILNLRIALQYAKDDVVPQIEYMLGRSYFYKDRANGDHYYADLAIKYLENCQEAGFTANDLFENLGLSYAALGQTDKSIAAFGEALLVRESDTLLLSLAEQYCNANNGKAAKQYLKRAEEITDDDEIRMRCLFLLAQILMDEKDYKAAEEQFNDILKKNSRSAEAHYGLGQIYESQGDLAKARAEWRSVLNLNPRHLGARQKMSESR